MPAKLTPKKQQEEDSFLLDSATKALIDLEIEGVMDVLDRPKAQPILLSGLNDEQASRFEVYATPDGSKRARVQVLQDYLDEAQDEEPCKLDEVLDHQSGKPVGILRDYLDLDQDEEPYDHLFARDLAKAMANSMETLEDETVVRSMNDQCSLGKRKQK